MVESGFRDPAGRDDEKQGHFHSHRRGWELELGELDDYLPAADPHTGRPMTPVAAEVDELWSAVADPTRRRVIGVLWTGGGDRHDAGRRAAGHPPGGGQAPRRSEPCGARGAQTAGARGAPRGPTAAARHRDAPMAQVAAEWDARLAAIKRIAESVGREPREEQTRQEAKR